MIADSSVLILYARAQLIDLLHHTVGPIEVVKAVRHECIDAALQRPDAHAFRAAFETGILRPIPADGKLVSTFKARYPNLGRGEIAVIAAAVKRESGQVLLDELPARKVARLEGLTPISSLGVLARVHYLGVLKDKEEVARAVRDILRAGLWVRAEVVEEFWSRLGGRE